MNSINVILKIVIIIYVVDKIFSYFFYKENFFPLANGSHVSIDNSIGKTISNKKDYFNEKNCCLVSKVFNKDKERYEYKFDKKDKCKITDATNNNMQHLFIDGVDGWNNKNCKPIEPKDKDPLGSCRIYNFECRDFLTQGQCSKYNMEWSDKTCQTPYKKPFQVSEREISYGSTTWKV